MQQLSEILPIILRRLSGARPASILVEIPPSCDEVPDSISQLRLAIEAEPDLRSRCATITADAARDDIQFVGVLLDEWSQNNENLRPFAAIKDSAPASPLQRLKHFLDLAIRLTGQPRIALIRRFDRVFRSMSSELLATMRSVEQEGWLITINSSPLPYDELYRRRAREDRGFTSDYGQSHARLTVGPLSLEEARRKWIEDERLSIDERLDEAYFLTSFTVSGALPALFATAAQIAASRWDSRPHDIRIFRDQLLQQLPATMLDRLLTYDEADTNSRLIEAVAKMHLGTASTLDVQFVCAHRWQELLLAKTAEGSVKLRSEMIGRRALRMLRERAPLPHADASALYFANNFDACLKVLGENGRHHHKLLYLAASMMNQVFADVPQSLYFGPSIKWREVAAEATAAADECTDATVRHEFEGWQRIAQCHGRLSSKEPATTRTAENRTCFHTARREGSSR